MIEKNSGSIVCVRSVSKLYSDSDGKNLDRGTKTAGVANSEHEKTLRRSPKGFFLLILM